MPKKPFYKKAKIAYACMALGRKGVTLNLWTHHSRSRVDYEFFGLVSVSIGKMKSFEKFLM